MTKWQLDGNKNDDRPTKWLNKNGNQNKIQTEQDWKGNKNDYKNRHGGVII